MNLRELAEQKFRKLLIARYSPHNKCLAENGQVLYAPPAKKGLGARHGASHDFLSATDHTTRSKFGWVKEADSEFTIDDFIDQYSIAKSQDQVEVLRQMFVAISKLPEDTPVAGSYFSRGVEDRRRVLDFHKVFLSTWRVGG